MATPARTTCDWKTTSRRCRKRFLSAPISAWPRLRPGVCSSQTAASRRPTRCRCSSLRCLVVTLLRSPGPSSVRAAHVFLSADRRLTHAPTVAAGFWWRQAVSRMGSFRYPVHFYLVENCEILCVGSAFCLTYTCVDVVHQMCSLALNHSFRLNHGGNLALLLIDFALGSQPVVLSQAIVL